MISHNVRRATVTALRVVIALIFCYAGWLKMQSLQAFADSIATFQLLPIRLTNLLALGLPPFEIMVGLLLLSGWKQRMATFCSLAASAIFLAALASAMIRGLPVECGCFGDAHFSLSPSRRLSLAIGRDILLVGAALVVYLDARRKS